MNEKFYQLAGYRKTGLVEPFPLEKELRIPLWEASGVKQKPVVLPSGHLDLNIYFQNQGKTPHCSSYGTSHGVEIEITKQTKKQAYCNAESLWKEQLKTGASEKYGDTIQNVVRTAKLGMFNVVEQKIYYPKFSLVSKINLKEAVLDQNCTVVTGLLADSPMCDSDWVWRNTGKGGGHMICIIDYKDGFYWALNSWKNFGIRKTGLFKIKEADAKYLYTCYAVTV